MVSYIFVSFNFNQGTTSQEAVFFVYKGFTKPVAVSTFGFSSLTGQNKTSLVPQSSCRI